MLYHQTKTNRSVLDRRMAADKGALCVIGAGEQKGRVRCVFGITHTAAKINNRYSCITEVKTRGKLREKGGNLPQS